MKYLRNFFACLTVLSLINNSQSCPTSAPIECLNGGILNTVTCQCECLVQYSGINCQIANCVSDYSECQNTNVNLCVFDFFRYNCAVTLCRNSNNVCTCGFNECLNGGIFSLNPCKCQCPYQYYGTYCENKASSCSNILTCQNSGTFNPDTCACDCTTGFSGAVCETGTTISTSTGSTASTSTGSTISTSTGSTVSTSTGSIVSTSTGSTVSTTTGSSAACGVPSITPNLQNRIIGGSTAIANSWPWQVYLAGDFTCGGILLDNQWILTAAHCTVFGETTPPSNFFGYLGAHNVQFSTLDSTSTRVTLSKQINHPDYSNTSATGANDIALLKMTTPVQLSDKISPVCLPNGKTIQIGETLSVTGWGVTNEATEQTADLLQQVDVTVNTDSTCTAQFGSSNLVTGQFCAGKPNGNPVADSCQGDSGGPIVKKDSATNSFWVAGIVSQGVGCKGHGVYTRVSTYESWITQTMQAN